MCSLIARRILLHRACSKSPGRSDATGAAARFEQDVERLADQVDEFMNEDTVESFEQLLKKIDEFQMPSETHRLVQQPQPRNYSSDP